MLRRQKDRVRARRAYTAAGHSKTAVEIRMHTLDTAVVEDKVKLPKFNPLQRGLQLSEIPKGIF